MRLVNEIVMNIAILSAGTSDAGRDYRLSCRDCSSSRSTGQISSKRITKATQGADGIRLKETKDYKKGQMVWAESSVAVPESRKET
jgi:hypothetical protein